MNAVRRCLIVVVVTLAVHPAFAAPGPVTRLVAPSGEVAMGTPITFSWQSNPESTWYLLWLGKGTPTALVMEQWYTAEQAECAAGGTCTVTVTAPVNAGPHVWFIQTWAAGQLGPWSPAMPFVVTAPHWSSTLPSERRFTLVLGDQGVLDHETGLVWQRTPNTNTYQWQSAHGRCVLSNASTRRGWRLPTVSELQSLVDNGQVTPALPAGHPFVGTLSFGFWTQTVATHDSTQHYAVDFTYGATGNYANSPSVTHGVWCVRAPSAGGQ